MTVYSLDVLLSLFGTILLFHRDFPGGSEGKRLPTMWENKGSIPGLGRSLGEGNGNPLQYFCPPPPKKGLKEIFGFPGGSHGKVSVYNVGDLGSLPQSGRSPGGGHGSPLQYSCLENPMDRGAWWATVHGAAKSQTQLNMHAYYSQILQIFCLIKKKYTVNY